MVCTFNRCIVVVSSEETPSSHSKRPDLQHSSSSSSTFSKYWSSSVFIKEQWLQLGNVAEMWGTYPNPGDTWSLPSDLASLLHFFSPFTYCEVLRLHKPPSVSWMLMDFYTSRNMIKLTSTFMIKQKEDVGWKAWEWSHVTTFATELDCRQLSQTTIPPSQATILWIPILTSYEILNMLNNCGFVPSCPWYVQ